MRPVGDVRRALEQAAAQLHQQQQPATWRAMAGQACVGYQAALTTVRNMVRAGVLQPVGPVRCPHSRRPMVAYAPRGFAAARPAEPTAALADALQAWAR